MTLHVELGPNATNDIQKLWFRKTCHQNI